MSHSTSRPWSKWYDSGWLMLTFYRWSDDDKAELYCERMEDEFERLRAADMMAKRFVDAFWPEIEVAILPPINGTSGWDIRRHRWDRRDEVMRMMQEFWREKV